MIILFVIGLLVSAGLGYLAAEIANDQNVPHPLIKLGRNVLALIMGGFSSVIAAFSACALTDDGRWQAVTFLAAITGIILTALHMRNQRQASKTIAAQ